VSADVDRYERSIFCVGCHNITDTNDPMPGVRQAIFDRKELNDIKAYMIEIMYMLEMHFPPSFFDMQEHLVIHLMDQILTLVLLYLHSMFSYKWFLSVLKA
jgi:hypothetical protein